MTTAPATPSPAKCNVRGCGAVLHSDPTGTPEEVHALRLQTWEAHVAAAHPSLRPSNRVRRFPWPWPEGD